MAAGLGAASLAYLLFSMDYYTTPSKVQVREARRLRGLPQGQWFPRRLPDADNRLDYYLSAGDRVQACAAKEIRRVERKVKGDNYSEVFHLISRPEPDQEMVSMLQRNFQPVHYERFDGAAVVTYKVGKHHSSAGPPQPKPPSGLQDNNDKVLPI